MKIQNIIGEKMITRDQIINRMKDFAQGNPRVHAMWLEGADGLGLVDEYSDIDVWFDVDDDHAAEFLDKCIWDLINGLGKLNVAQNIPHQNPFILQMNVRLADSSPYLFVDICVQKHSRPKDATTYTRGDIAELPKVIFDKSNVIRFKDPEPHSPETVDSLLQSIRGRFDQRTRATKYIHRGNYIEAITLYQEYVVDPIIEIARLVYTPRIYNYGTCHISRHLPKSEIKKIERLFQNRNLDDLKKNVKYAEKLIDEYSKKF